MPAPPHARGRPVLKRPRFPEVKPVYYPLKGGLDLVTPPIAIDPGRLFDAQNYEPVTVGGYRRLTGFERFDGRPKPSAASYWVIGANVTGVLNVGDTVTGATSAATGRVLLILPTYLVLGRVTGTFVVGENLNVAATPRAVTTSAAGVNGATSPSLHADYRLLAANDRRADITQVPGSGPVRGVWLFNDVVYAFKDNLAGTAGVIWKSSGAGWVQVALGKEVQFSGATGEIFVGNTVTGATSGASGVVLRAMLRTGTWSSAGAGTLIFATVTGAFQNGENLQVTAVTKAVAASASTDISRLPGGRVEIITANFTGATVTRRMYGADGVNFGFEFDGTTYVPIRTGMAVDKPEHVTEHINRLWFSFGPSVQYSGPGTPFTWTPVLGANELTTGDPVRGMLSQSGASTGAALAIACDDRLFMLYGSTTAEFKLVPSNDDLGFAAFSMAGVGNDCFGLTARGIQALKTTLNYGDFDFAAISFLIQPLLERKRNAGLTCCATTIKGKNLYRLFFSDGSGVVVGLTGGKVNGICPVAYGRAVTCVCTGTLSSGQEVTFFGADDGLVYQDDVGTSFDGGPVQAWIQPVFNNLQSPLVRKQFRRGVFEAKSEGYSQVNISYDLGYATPNVAPAALEPDLALSGNGGYWDQFFWDEFSWDAPVVSDAAIQIDGIEKNISFIFYSNRAQDDSHTVQGISLLFTPRRLERA